MRPEEIARIKLKHNAAIIAPAGHGKTEIIVDLVKATDRKALLLTHTNAGVEALKKRLNKKSVDKNKYSLYTIAGFCMIWCNAYPSTAEIDKNIGMKDAGFYQMLYSGAEKIFSHQWARNVLSKSYERVIVDEYQDCIIAQHHIFLEINKTLPVIVLGDPLQAIFGWADKLVSWKNIGFEPVDIKTKPWRWKETNPELGEYLNSIIDVLKPALDGKIVQFQIQNIDGCVSKLPASCKRSIFKSIPDLRKYHTVAFISTTPNEQQAIGRQTGGIFENDEKVDINELFQIAETIDRNNGAITAKAMCDFLPCIATHINDELRSYVQHVEQGSFDFRRTKKYPEFGKLLGEIRDGNDTYSILKLLDWIRKEPAFNIYRRELYYELCRSLRYSKQENITVAEAATKIRTLPQLHRSYSQYRFLSTRTVLSKGLEFECVIIDLASKGKKMTATDFYVAMTRATKMIYILSDQDTLTLQPPLGIDY